MTKHSPNCFPNCAPSSHNAPGEPSVTIAGAIIDKLNRALRQRSSEALSVPSLPDRSAE